MLGQPATPTGFWISPSLFKKTGARPSQASGAPARAGIGAARGRSPTPLRSTDCDDEPSNQRTSNPNASATTTEPTPSSASQGNRAWLVGCCGYGCGSGRGALTRCSRPQYWQTKMGPPLIASGAPQCPQLA